MSCLYAFTSPQLRWTLIKYGITREWSIERRMREHAASLANPLRLRLSPVVMLELGITEFSRAQTVESALKRAARSTLPRFDAAKCVAPAGLSVVDADSPSGEWLAFPGDREAAEREFLMFAIGAACTAAVASDLSSQERYALVCGARGFISQHSFDGVPYLGWTPEATGFA